jgi:hypothetical protein
MKWERASRGTLDQLPRVSHCLTLLCRPCGARGIYDVGTIFLTPEGWTKQGASAIGFTNYFRCRTCKGPGPWDLADRIELEALLSKRHTDQGSEGIYRGRMEMFDGSSHQTPAMSEEYLLKLIEASPHNAFLCTRLGNLLRGCDLISKASGWYARALDLDPGDIEARHHLFSFAVQADDPPAARRHALALVQHLLEGRTTAKEDVTEGIALYLIDHLRDAPDEFRKGFLKRPAGSFARKEEVFIRALLEEQGDETAIAEAACERLLRGDAALEEPCTPASSPPAVPVVLAAPLRPLIEDARLNAGNLSVPLLADGQGHIKVEDRHSVNVSDGSRHVVWHVPSLRALFRGSQPAPADIKYYPPEYADHFWFIEKHVLTLCKAKGDPPDQEMEEVYSALRRRPDGRSLGATHDFFWQVLALWLGSRVVSEAGYEAVVGQLVRSVRGWALRPISRNYATYLHGTFER